VCILGDGNDLLFWSDPWLDGAMIADLAPNLLAAVPLRWRRKTVAQALDNGVWIRDITCALTILVLVQYLLICHQLLDFPLSPGTNDHFISKWSASGAFSSRSAYRALFLGQAAVLGASQLWKVMVPDEYHFFMWLVLYGHC
jgi:hypothetical protein